MDARLIGRWLLVAVVAVAAFLSALRSVHGAELRSGAFKPARTAPEISLQGSDASELKLSRYRGKVVALGFGYTSCPDVCPTTLFDLAQVRTRLGAAGRDLQVVYVTVDPERDTPERLKAYLATFDPTFVGGAGTREQIAAALKAYGIVATRQEVAGSKTAYLVHHSSFVYLIDRTGNIRALLPFGIAVEDIEHDVRVLLGR
jgi:protein SCO1/2